MVKAFGAAVVLSAGGLLQAGPVSLLKPTGLDAATGAVFVELDARALAEMALEPLAVVRDLPLVDGRSVTLNLRRFEVLTNDAVLVHVGPEGEVEMPRPDVQLWRGSVEGDPGSTAYLALSGELGTNGFVVLDDKIHMISTARGGGRTVVHELGQQMPADLDAGARPPLCSGPLIPEGFVPRVQREVVERGTYPCKRFTIAVDTDTEFTTVVFNGSETNAQSYITILMGAVSSIYERDVNIRLEVPYIRTWTASDPYSSNGTCSQLNQFRNHWNSNQGSVQRNAAHLLSGRPLGGGCAYLSSLCDASAYGVSADLVGGFPNPVQDNHPGNWDVIVVAHELGHNFGSGHTHEVSAYNPIIDGCGNGDCSQAAQGTIMSYCHQCGGGLTNIAMSFGTRVEAAIRNYVDVSVPSCGTSLPAFTNQPVPASPAQGDPVTFTASAIGIGEFQYQWLRNGQPLAGNSRITGVNTTTLSINPALPSDTGTYSLRYQGDCSTITSSGASLDVVPACTGGQVPPTISAPPVAQSVNRGLTAVFTVGASDAGAISYQWRRNAAPLVDDGRITGAQTAELRIENAASTDSGLYSVVVTGSQCYAATTPVSLQVIATPAPFGLTTPANGATEVATNPFFQWQASQDAVNYTITIDDDPAFGSPVLNLVRTVTTLQTAPNTLTVGRTYYWRVLATNPLGQIAGAPAVASFATIAPPPVTCPGDSNGDNLVNGADLSLLLGQFGGPAPPNFGADYNNDGLVNGADLSILLFRFGTSCL